MVGKSLSFTEFYKILLYPNLGISGQIIAIISILVSLGLFTLVPLANEVMLVVFIYLLVIPVILAGLIFKLPGGVLVGVIVAILLNAFIPMNTDLNIPSSSAGWILPYGFNILIGSFVGITAAILSAGSKRIKELSDFELEPRLPQASTFSILAAPYKKSPEKYTICVISIRNYADIQAVFGYMTAKETAIKVFTNFQEQLADESVTVLRISSKAIGVVRPGSMLDGAAFLSNLANAIPRYIRIRNIRLPIRPAIGVAEAESGDLSQQAPFDEALFACEKAATETHGVAIFDAAELKSRQSNLSLMDDLYKDLDQGGCLSMHFQPKSSLKDNMIHSAEALIRWDSPKHGYVSPDRFIPLAEKSGLISGVTKWVLSQTVQELELWRKLGIPIDMSVNLAADDLVNEEIIDILHSLPKRLGGAFNGLELELTETGLVKDFEATAMALKDLRTLGYRIAIDDFGTGYSSLQQFKRINVDTVKIDQYFITDLLKSKESQDIVSASIAMCRSRGIHTVAEGVEDVQVIELLRQLGCDYVQGYAIAKPMPADTFRTWLSGQQYPGAKISR